MQVVLLFRQLMVANELIDENGLFRGRESFLLYDPVLVVDN